MSESQNIEYKESWDKEYLKWVCGFANAQGGRIYVGIDDKGNVIGVKNAKKLMEDMYISNQCRMPKNWTEKTLMGTHRSIPYNPLMANVFFRAGYIETWGRGVQKICEACKRHGSPVPSYEILGDSIIILFKARPNSIWSEDDQKKVQMGAQIKPSVHREIDGKIVDAVQFHSDITMSELADQIGVSYKTIQRAMTRLRQAGVMDRTGGNRHGKWVIKS